MENISIILDWIFVLFILFAPWVLLVEIGIFLSFLFTRRPLKWILIALAVTIGIPVCLLLARTLLPSPEPQEIIIQPQEELREETER